MWATFNPCEYGAEYRKETGLLCSPGWKLALDARCRWVPESGRFSCGHTDDEGCRPHVTLGAGGAPTGPAAEYADGLVEAWALEIL